MIGAARIVVATAVIAAAAAPGRAQAEETTAAADTEPRPKKQIYLEDKASSAAEVAKAAAARQKWERQLDRRIGKKPTPVVNVFNTWTHEFLAFETKTKAPPPAAMVNWFLRCHFTNEPTKMDARLFPVLIEAAKKFDSRRIDIVSGFRHDKYNLILRKKGHGVARDSQHTHGNAVDFRVRGVSVSRLRDWAQTLRLGGVGYYPGSGFVHVDTGKIRTWTDN